MGNKSNRKPPKDTTTLRGISLWDPDAVSKLKADPDALMARNALMESVTHTLKGFRASMDALAKSAARTLEELREIAEAHREIDNGLTKAINFWEKIEPEVAAVYREFRDALRDATAFNIPEVFMDGTATARIRAMTRRRRDKRDKLAEKVRAKARELQTKRPMSQRALRAHLARNSEKLFGAKLSEPTIRRYIEKAGDT